VKAVNRVKQGFYADSVALMRIARELQKDGIEASLMIGTPSNKALLKESGLLSTEGAKARPDDLIIAVKGRNTEAALDLAEKLLASGPAASSALPAEIEGANLVLISVPGEFAAAEAQRALERGLNVMMFSDNVPVADEVALKDYAIMRGLLMLGPDCGTALIAGTPIAFANAVPRGSIGVVSASGTGLQEVSTLLARAGKGVSHGIGVGGRDLSAAVGGRMTLAAMDALEADPATKRIIVISKPPSPSVTKKIVARARRGRKPVVLCLLGFPGLNFSSKIRLARTLAQAAGISSSGKMEVRAKGGIRGFFCGGTLCAEAQIVLMDHGLSVSSNVPVPGAKRSGAPHRLLDLGADEYTRGHPHPMIEPALRNGHIERALRDRSVGLVLLDLVIGYGAHADPAGLIADVVGKSKKPVIASVTGTEGDPQVYSLQVKKLRAAGVIVTASNAAAARTAALAMGGRSPVTTGGKPCV
jgi:FdrA protein